MEWGRCQVKLWGFCVNCAPDGAVPVLKLVQEPPITYRSGMRALGESQIGLRVFIFLVRGHKGY